MMEMATQSPPGIEQNSSLIYLDILDVQSNVTANREPYMLSASFS